MFKGLRFLKTENFWPRLVKKTRRFSERNALIFNVPAK
jgi:hypothetical protein